jgi:hypothetical protein
MTRIIDLALLLAALEAVGIVAYHARNGRGPKPAPVLATLAAGGFLLVALRLTLAAAPLPWIGACLLGALVAHGVDMRNRWGS